MAQGFLVCTAPDSYISYFQKNPGLVHYYLDGTPPPEEEMSSPLPEWWPKEAPELLSSWCVNYRNTELYHWILNGGPELVDGGGAIFQMWHEPEHATSVVKLDKYNERFAFYSNQISELSSLVAAVNINSVLRAFIDWCKSQGKEGDSLDEYACQPFVDEFKAFGNLLGEASCKGHGIIW